MFGHSYILLNCKSCKHQFLVDIKNRPYDLLDIASKNKRGMNFWGEKIKCPKCSESNEPKLLFFSPTDDENFLERIKQFKPITEEDLQQFTKIEGNMPGKMIILEDAHKYERNKIKKN